MRTGLWPDADEEHARDIDAYFANASRVLATFVTDRGDGSLAGFLEAGTRAYAEDCESSPVAFHRGLVGR